MTRSNCPFCNEKIKDCCFLESENFMSVYNIAPVLPGHSMVISKKHIERFKEMPSELFTEMMELIKQTTEVLEKVFNTTGFDLTLQDGISAGQTVMHIHFHIIPRKENDLESPGDWYPIFEKHKNDCIDSESRVKLSDNHMSAIVERLRKGF